MTMRLGVRLTVYYVTSIGVILTGFSVALYSMASKHLYRQVDEQIESAINTLAAAAEIGPEGVTWEPEERSLSFGRRTFEGRFFWQVADVHGKRIDGSATGEIDRFLARLGAGNGLTRQFASFTDESGVGWRAVTRRLEQPYSESRSPGNCRLETCPSQRSYPQCGNVSGQRANEPSQPGAFARGTVASCMDGRGSSPAGDFAASRCDRWPRCPTRLMRSEVTSPEGGCRRPETDDELGELGRSFNALLDRLGESLERQQRFTVDASHQLGTPLTAAPGSGRRGVASGPITRGVSSRPLVGPIQDPAPPPDRRRLDVSFPRRRRGPPPQP